MRLDDRFRRDPSQFSGFKARSRTSNQRIDIGSSLARLAPRSGPTQIDRESRC